jgi:MSHA biogenesis protein MshM
MIRSHFGLQRHPFDTESISLLAHQQEVFDILRVHAQQGGLCLVLGEPGTGKSVLKAALLNHDPKRLITPVVNRTLHTYHNTLRILCEAFQIEFEGRDHRCERLLVQEAFKIHRAGKMLVPIIDDAHLMPSDCLRKLRLLCEDFPHSHNLVLIGQPPLLQSLALSINEEIRSRVTYSVVLPRLAPETIEAFILAQLDRAGLGHNTFTPEALALIVRSGEGLLRRTRNLCLSSLIEAVRDQTRLVDLKQVNRVLIQPHWRKDCDSPAPTAGPVLLPEKARQQP